MNWLNILDSICFLEDNKVSCIETYIVDTKSKLSKYTQFPYVMKLSSQLLHKTEEKAVICNIYTKEELIKAFDYLQSILKKNKITGNIILQKQIVDGLELIIGIKEDPQFGKTIVFGSGGIYTEQFNDVAIKLLPVNKKDIENIISETKISKLLAGKRNKTYNVKDLKKLILNISNLAIKKDIKELDLNPVIVTKDDVFVVDARMKLK